LYQWTDHSQPKPTILPRKRSAADVSNSSVHQTKKQRISQVDRVQEAVKIALSVLTDEFEQWKVTSDTFPPRITSSEIRTSVSEYESQILEASKRSICSCCGILVAVSDVYNIDNGNDIIRPLQHQLNHCGYYRNSWDFCASCHSALKRGTIPKFSAKNYVNVTTTSSNEEAFVVYNWVK